MPRPRLPLVDPHRRDTTYCAFCPKLSQFTCPVSTVQGRQTTTPWGKMTTLHHVAEGNLPFDASHASTFWACTGCFRCRSSCAHGVEVAEALNAGRAEAVRARVAPPEALAVRSRHPEREAKSRHEAERLFGKRLRRKSRHAFVPGCTALTLAPRDAEAALAVTEALAGEPVSVFAEACCGLPLLEAGDPSGFRAAARRFLRGLADAEEVTFLDPGCLHALRVRAPKLGVESRPGLRHLTEYAVGHLDRFRTLPDEAPMRWHDPCRLGRGLGVYEAPRALLNRILGAPPREFHQHRERAECSGAGGQLPRTDRETAQRIAAERRHDHTSHGGGTLVTGCPGAKHMLQRDDASFTAIELSQLLLRALA